MAKYIINQNMLAKAAGITPGHLSGIKTGNRQISVPLATLLCKLTDIPIHTWIVPALSKTRKRDLKNFFLNQVKLKEESQ